MSVLDIDVAEKAFGSTVILRQVRLQLAEREAAILLGPSGCGKSTLLRIAGGLDARFTGHVTRPGGESDQDVTFVFQEPRLMPWLTVAENVGFRDGKGFDKTRANKLIADVGLQGFADALPKALSGGMAQRVAIARALYTAPRILLMDEPFSAVDAFTRMKLEDLVLELVASRGISFLLVTHDIDEALYLGDRIYMMGSRPGTIQREIVVDVERPRDRRDPRLSSLKVEVLTALQEAQLI